ncbi:MAG TPA: TetR/AcrR family transcriptional regulator [Frankiaceae bacterium]|nr:TetR/AcrR family transcriptional regulator [Frankiaceae bacterium]
MTAPATTRSGRRRALSKGDRREHAILDTARDLLQTRSLASLTIDELAAGAGISRSSFYFYFDGKSAVLAALLEDLASELAAENSPWLDGTGPDEPALRAAISHSVELWRTSGGLLRQALSSGAPEDPLTVWRATVVGRGIRRLTARIERDRAAGLSAGPPSPESLAWMTSAMRNQTLAERAGTMPDAELVDDLVHATLRLLYGH